MKPPQLASDFEKVPIRRSTSSSTPKSSRGARAARAQHADAVGLVDHQPRAVGAAELGDAGHVADVALHRVDAVHDHQHAAAVPGRPLEHLLELLEPAVAERPQPRARELAPVEDRGVVAGVRDHGVGGAQDAERQPRLAW